MTLTSGSSKRIGYPAALYTEVKDVAKGWVNSKLLWAIFGEGPPRGSLCNALIHLELLWLALGRARCRSLGKHELTGSRGPMANEVWLRIDEEVFWCERCKFYIVPDPME